MLWYIAIAIMQGVLHFADIGLVDDVLLLSANGSSICIPVNNHSHTYIITLGAHAQRGYGSWVCLSVCYSTSHFLSVCSSHKGYDLLNGQ